MNGPEISETRSSQIADNLTCGKVGSAR